METTSYPINPTISFGEAVKRFYSNYAIFSGRARRSEYWWASLFTAIAVIVAYSISLFFNFFTEGVSILLCTVIILFLIPIPSLAVTIRRLHDVDKSGWYILLSLIPVIGAIILLFFCCKDSTIGENEWGISPKYSLLEASDDGGSNKRLTSWSYIWPFLLLIASIVLYFTSLSYMMSSMFGGFDDVDIEELQGGFEDDSSMIMEELDSAAIGIVPDSIDSETLPDTTAVGTN